jgi:hypothetical protein
MKRFSLRALLVVTTAIAIFFGYAVVRRRAILENCQVLRAKRVQFELPEAWQDSIWQRRPRNLVVETTTMPNGSFEEDTRMRATLENMGYFDVKYMVRVTPDE